MGQEARQRTFLVARVAAVLIAVVAVLLVASRATTNQKDTLAAEATRSPSATHSAARAAASAAASPAQVTAERSLCQAVTSLVGFSIQVLGQPHQGGAINVSNAVTVTKATQARSMAGQFCALPVLPAKPGFCLDNLGEWFQLIFDPADGEYWTVWVTNGGCEQVIGVGDQTRTAMSAGPRLWPALLADLRGAKPLAP